MMQIGWQGVSVCLKARRCLVKYVTPTSLTNARHPSLSGDISESDPRLCCPGVVITDVYPLKRSIPAKNEVKSHPVQTYNTCKISLRFSRGIECSSGSSRALLLHCARYLRNAETPPTRNYSAMRACVIICTYLRA